MALVFWVWGSPTLLYVILKKGDIKKNCNRRGKSTVSGLEKATAPSETIKLTSNKTRINQRIHKAQSWGREKRKPK